MTAAHFHLLVNHVPILGSAFALFLLLLSLHPRFGTNVRRAALVFFVITGLFSFISVESGEAAHHMIHGAPGILSSNVEAHEEAAETANVFAIITGLAALFLLVMEWIDRKLPGFVKWVVYLLGIVTFVLMAIAGEKGGLIRHPEVVPGWTAQSQQMQGENPADPAEEQEGEMEEEHESTE